MYELLNDHGNPIFAWVILAGLAAGLRSIDVSPDLISTIMDAVLDEVAEWHMQGMSAPRYLQVKLADVTTPA